MAVTPHQNNFQWTKLQLSCFYNVFLSSWCRLRHQKKVEGVNVVMVEGLTQSHFYRNYLTMEHLRTNYTTVSYRSVKPPLWILQ